MNDEEYLVRRWVFDPAAPIPVWVCRKFHDVTGERSKLVSVAFGEARIGDTICYQAKGQTYWVEKKDQPMSEGYETKWDQDAKRRRDAEREAEQQAKDAVGIRRQCVIIWNEETEKLDKLARRTKRKGKDGQLIGGVTPQEILDAFSRIYMEVDRRTANKPFMEDFRRETLTMLEDARGHAIAAQLGTDANYIREVPIQAAVFGSNGHGLGSVMTKVAAFRSEQEFEAIEFVAAWRARPDFVGFMLDSPRAVVVLTKSGEVHLVGHVGSRNYLSYPAAQAMQKAVEGGEK